MEPIRQTAGGPRRASLARLRVFAVLFALGACLGPGARAAAPVAGADQQTPSRAQYFSWINNTNEGATENQTKANLACFQWLHDEFGMTLDIYAFDAGFVDGKNFSAILEKSERFKTQFPHGLGPLVRAAEKMGTRLGHWGGPDGFGSTPEEEQQRVDMMVGLCRDYQWSLFKFDGVCGELRPEKESAFIRMMKACRQYSPDLIALNHRLPLGEEGRALMTTSLWDGQETYVDVHLGNRVTAPHHRAQALSRGNTTGFSRLFEDHGVCISSCPDNFDDDLVLQAFGRNLILAPEVYGNPWLLRDDEFPKFARLFNLARRYRDLLVNATALPSSRYGANAVSRGDASTRLLTLRNLSWEPVTYTLSSGEEIGLAKADQVEWRRFHPTERALGTCRYGDTIAVTVEPFRACLLLATTKACPEIGVSGCDYQVVRDTPGKPALVRLLGLPGTQAAVSLLPGGRQFKGAALAGRRLPGFAKGEAASVAFEGVSLARPWHRKLGVLAPVALPPDAESLYEATCFAADNNALEVRSLARAGATKIPAVKAARDAFFSQSVFIGRGLWDRYLFDGQATTSFYPSRRWGVDPRINAEAPLRLDFGEVLHPQTVELTIPDAYSLYDLFEGEGGSIAEVSTDLKTWTAIPFIHGEHNRIPIPPGLGVRYVRLPKFLYRISEVNAYAGGRPLSRDKWRASNLFGGFSQMDFRKAWAGTIRVDDGIRGAYLCVALNGRHGVEGAYAALRTAKGRIIGAPDRATSYPSNPWEFPNCKRDRNYTYYFPVTPEMVGQTLEVVALGTAGCDDNLQPEVWQTAPAAPFIEKLLELDPP